MYGDYVCMFSSLVPEWLDGFYSNSVFKSLSVPCRCPVIINYSISENRCTSNAPPKQNGGFCDINRPDYIYGT
jgi:hypothetical protein